MTPERLAKLASACLDAARAEFAERGDPELLRFVDDVAALDRSRVQRGPLPMLNHPAMAHLAMALAERRVSGPLAAAAAEASAGLDWAPVYEDAQIGVGVSDGMLAAQMAGTYGVFASDTLAFGLFLLAPGLHYPEHTHEAEEIYYCVSGALTLRYGLDAAPLTIRAGEYAITPPHRLHALTTGDEATLLVYVWRGELRAPIWLWERSGKGWERVQWLREPGHPWRQARREPVDTAHFRQATE